MQLWHSRIAFHRLAFRLSSSCRNMSNDTRSYKDAIDCLNTLQSNAATVEAARLSGGRLAQFAMHETEEYLSRIGYSPQDLNRLNIIHVAGTKGKGSTCAFVDSTLRHVMPDWTVGFYSSPHLVAVRERIRINGKPISESDFATYFFHVWDRLEKNPERKFDSTTLRPMYFRMLTLVAFHAFISLNVNATILEVGVGGTYDCTNIIPRPIVTGISALGFDHVAILGKTMKEIAWQKAGIFKEGVPAFSVIQPKDALEVLKSRADELRASSLTLVSPPPDFYKMKLGIPGVHQYQNAYLATQLTKEFLRQKGIIGTSESDSLQHPNIDTNTDPDIEKTLSTALARTKWPGRCQTIPDPKYERLTWFLDGAHTDDSLRACLGWFVSPDGAYRHAVSNKSQKSYRILIFNCTSGRNGRTLLNAAVMELEDRLRDYWYNILNKGRDVNEDGITDDDRNIDMDIEARMNDFFDVVIFCTNTTYVDGGFKSDLTSRIIIDQQNQSQSQSQSQSENQNHPHPLQTQIELKQIYQSLFPKYPGRNIHVLGSIEEAYRVVVNARKGLGLGEEKDKERDVDVLVTGSLHLVGGIMDVAQLSDWVV